MKIHDIDINEQALAEYCHRHGIRELLFFGSITRADFRSESDIDVIVNFHDGQKPDLFDFAGMELELTETLGRTVHLHTDEMIPSDYRRVIKKTALTAYAA